MGKTINYLFLLIFFISTTHLGAAVQPSSRVLSFKDWKSQQVIQHQNRVARLKNQLVFLKTNPRRDMSSTARNRLNGDLNKLLVRAQKDLQIAQELDFQDYLAVYLKGLNAKDIQQLAQKLTAQEVAELLKHIKRQQ